ncbi:hypothetical protein AXA65_18310 [Chryseobacterium sp. FP211-J200]|nr:hypothetical protein AXA65_18310 [Chryseobacterium sp. FP211-J200]
MQSCNKDPKTQMMTEDNFNYAVTVSAPKEYPCEVHIGYLADDKNNMICGIPKAGMESGGFQYDGAKAGMGGNIIPSHIYLTYVAYAEKKFYHLDAALPKDKILAAFRKGFLVQSTERDANGKRKLEHSTYDTFTVALAPGGMVVIFLGARQRIEICRLQAKETFVDKNQFRPHPQLDETQQQFFETKFKIAVPDSIQTKIKEKGIPYGLYDSYRKKYNYRFLFTPYDEKDLILRQYNKYYNGEVNSILQSEEIAKKEYKEQSIPYNVEFIFKVYNTEIVFNDQEMLSVFDALQKRHPDKPMDIIIKPTFEYTDFKLSVKCEDEVIPLEKYKVKGVWGG